MSQMRSSLDEFAQTAGAGLPLPGSGGTWARFATLAEWASRDLSLGRLCEGHADALAILAEAGMQPVRGAAYGVWASRSPTAATFAERTKGGWRLSGVKEFCSGSGIIDRALVSATTCDGQRMFDVSVAEQVASVVPDSWPSCGMAGSVSETLEFGGPAISEEFVVGRPEFYTSRPGFWFGATGVAACWYGGAVGLIKDLVEWVNPDPSELVLMDLGEAVSALEAIRTSLQIAASEIDQDPLDEHDTARFRAIVTRQLAHECAKTVLERVASAGGARPLCHHEGQSRRAADLYIYLSQHRGRRDAVELGRRLLKGRS